MCPEFWVHIKERQLACFTMFSSKQTVSSSFCPITQKSSELTLRAFYCDSSQFASEIAPTGHTASQAPQSMQPDSSITYCVSPWEITPTGHSPAQLPQLTQASEILRAIIKILLDSSKLGQHLCCFPHCKRKKS